MGLLGPTEQDEGGRPPDNTMRKRLILSMRRGGHSTLGSQRLQEIFRKTPNCVKIQLNNVKFYPTSNTLHRVYSLLSSITEPTQLQVDGVVVGGEPLVYDSSQPPSLNACEDGCEQDKVEQGGIKRVCFKVNEEDQEDSGHDTMSYRDSYR